MNLHPALCGLVGFTLVLLAACRPVAVLAGRVETATPFQPSIATKTPFLPQHPTLPPQADPAVPLTYQMMGIDFSPGAQEITLRLWPGEGSLQNGKPIKIRFLPAETCTFGDHQACVYHFRSAGGGEVIWVSVHSGVGGEGQELRHSLEGTGINAAGLSLEQVAQNLAALKQADITLQQGEMKTDLTGVVATTRIPATLVREYLAAPIAEALQIAFESDSDAWQQIQSAVTLLVIETCGWRMPGEDGSSQVSDTTASIYLVVIR